VILLVTNRRDVTTDFVVAALRRRGGEFIRMNTDDLLRSWSISWRPSGWRARDGRGRSFSSNDVSGAYYRRPRAANPVDGTAMDAGPFAIREAAALVRGLIAHTDCDWVSDPSAIELAEDKLLQLRMAEKLGLTIPRTLVTNVPEEARAFVASVSRAIVKPLSSGHLGDDPPLIAYTTAIDEHDPLNDIALAPHLLQERVDKQADVRVTVVDDRVFACRIDSQGNPNTTLDWRIATSTNVPLGHVMMTLPSDVELACVRLVRALGLRFGAIDLIERPDGFTFLEINPNGQWAWIEQRTCTPISDAIAKALTGARIAAAL
jgi:glutathione synthase/RimK-type ligase-like ATP-grasp enzyme